MNHIEAMKQALEALNETVKFFDGVDLDDSFNPPTAKWAHNVQADVLWSITSLRQAIEQAEKQEPVAWINPKWPEYCGPYSPVTVYEQNGWKPLYTTPQPQQAEKQDVEQSSTESKETFDQPVAQVWDEGYRAGVNDERMSEANIGIAGFGAKVEPARNNPYRTTPLNSVNSIKSIKTLDAQPKREWAGLTDEQRGAINSEYQGVAALLMCEAKLREKNGGKDAT